MEAGRTEDEQQVRTPTGARSLQEPEGVIDQLHGLTSPDGRRSTGGSCICLQLPLKHWFKNHKCGEKKKENKMGNVKKKNGCVCVVCCPLVVNLKPTDLRHSFVLTRV